ncbi:DinB family protein [Paludifilum halophilum]|uniref:DinB family protein n=1 Tax=Paludifilum halophilum TaxID=1642702 RepID=UPI00146C631A|nr:DinB family protein [Paludifilum halophilum]
MNHFLITQFEMGRERLQSFLQSTPETLSDQMPKGFNNTIHWNAGHILTVADALFELKMLPPKYKELFWNGTKPADWTGDVPSLKTLISQLQEQMEPIKETLSDGLEKKLEKPIQLPNGYQMETTGSVVGFNNSHEAIHMGYMNALKRTIEGQSQ